MTNKTSISLYTSTEEKNIITDASKLLGLDYSAFCRMSSLERARKIIKENREDIQ